MSRVKRIKRVKRLLSLLVKTIKIGEDRKRKAKRYVAADIAAEDLIEELARLKFSCRRETIASLDRDYTEYSCSIHADWHMDNLEKGLTCTDGECESMPEAVLLAVGCKAGNNKWVLDKKIEDEIET